MIKWFAKTEQIDLLGPFDDQIKAWEVLIEELGESDIPPSGSMVWPVLEKPKDTAPEQILISDMIYPYKLKRR